MNNELEGVKKEAMMAWLGVPGFASAPSLVSVIMIFSV
jgi:hypothetical protein